MQFCTVSEEEKEGRMGGMGKLGQRRLCSGEKVPRIKNKGN